MIESPDFSFMLYGCTELANNARLSAYVQWAAETGAWEGSDCCVEMPRECWCPNDGLPTDYVDPITDGACWVDPLVPESSEYLGLYITNVGGLRDSAFTRGATENIGRGVTLGRGRSGSRVFTITALVIGTSCCGVDYGIEYLRRVLEQGGCGAGTCLEGCDALGSCGLTCMTGRVCCPEGETDDGLRQWVNVGLVDGVKEVEESGMANCHCCMREVTFIVQSETAESYSCDPVICLDKDADLENTATRCFDWINGCPDELEQDPECTDDPACPPNACVLPAPPNRVNNCFCEPIGVSIDCCCAADQANHRDETYRITITAGRDPSNVPYTQYGQRNTRVKLYTNDPKKSCPSDDFVAAQQWSRGDECASLDIPFLKPGAKLVIDGRTERVSVECDGKCYPGWASVFAPTGDDPFPILSSCNGIFACIEWDLGTTQFEVDPGAGKIPAHVKVERFKVYA